MAGLMMAPITAIPLKATTARSSPAPDARAKLVPRR